MTGLATRTSGAKKPDTGGKETGKDAQDKAKDKPAGDKPKTAGNDGDDDYITGDEEIVKPVPVTPKVPVKPEKPRPVYNPKPGLVASGTDADGDSVTVVVNPNGTKTITKVTDGEKTTQTKPLNPKGKEDKKEVKPEPKKEEKKEAQRDPNQPKPAPKDDDDLLEGD